MDKVWRLMHKVRTNYSSCTAAPSENICSNEGAQEKRKTGWNSNVSQKYTVFASFNCSPSLNVNVFFFLASFIFESHPIYDQTQGSGAVFWLLYE
jgi:hypothetical protein